MATRVDAIEYELQNLESDKRANKSSNDDNDRDDECGGKTFIDTLPTRTTMQLVEPIRSVPDANLTYIIQHKYSRNAIMT